MKPAKTIYMVRKCGGRKAFRIPIRFVNLEKTYNCEETDTGLRFVPDGGPYKVIGEAKTSEGKCRYGLIKFVSDEWVIGSLYTVDADGDDIVIDYAEE